MFRVRPARRFVFVSAFCLAALDLLAGAALAADASVSAGMSCATPTIVGTDGNDSLAGTSGNDVIAGGAGNDTINGYGGNDVICGDGGDDQLLGGTGADGLSGGDGNDALYGGPGNDGLNGGTGIDSAYYTSAPGAVAVSLEDGTASGAAGSDSLAAMENVIGSLYSDSLTGDAGPNWLAGRHGDDVLSGGGGNDKLTGDLGTDTFNAGEGDDAVYPSGGGDDIVNADGGNDTISGAVPGDTVDGGAGSDWLLLGGGSSSLDPNVIDAPRDGEPVDVDLAVGTISGGGKTSTVAAIENVHIYSGVLVGDAGPNTLKVSFDGVLSGGGGDDILIAGATPSTVWVSYANAPGAVSVNLETAIATGEGRDRLLNVKNVLGSAFDDTLTGRNTSNRLDGGAGNDTIYGRAGRDMLKGSEGDDALFGESTDDYLDGGPGFDSLDGGSHRVLGERVFGDACVEGEALLNCEGEESVWWPPR